MSIRRNIQLSVCTLALAFVATNKLQAQTLGDAVLAGSGCVSASTIIKPDSQNPNRLSIALNTYLKKEESQSLERVACSLSLPITLKANEKLIVSDVAKQVNFRLNGGDLKATANLEVFLAGQQSNVSKLSVSSTEVYSRTTLFHEKQGVVAESECGQSVILRANESISGIGENVRARVYGEDLKLTLDVVACQ